MDILSEIIRIMTGGIASFGQGLGSGIQAIVQALFVNIDSTTGTQTLTVFGTLTVVFAALALCVGITRKIFGWVVTLGGRK